MQLLWILFVAGMFAQALYTVVFFVLGVSAMNTFATPDGWDLNDCQLGLSPNGLVEVDGLEPSCGPLFPGC